MGDTVLVGPGTYYENVVVIHRLTLLSERGASVTSIDARENGTVVVVGLYGEGSTISGFRIRGGSSTTYAGGIHVEVYFGIGGRVTISGNIVESNYSYGWAGGVSAERDCAVRDNVIQYNNQQSSEGVSALIGQGTIRGNVIRFNGNGNFNVVRIIGDSHIEGNMVVDNGFVLGAVVGVGGGSVVVGNTVANNGCGVGSSAVVVSGSLPCVIANNIVVYYGCDGLMCSDGGVVEIQCNDVWGSVGEPYTGGCAAAGGTNGNFSSDPLFCNASLGDYRIESSSPCAAESAPPGCGLIGALSVGCGASGIEGGGSVAAGQRLMVLPNPASGVVEFRTSRGPAGGVIEIYDSRGAVVQVLGGRADPIRWLPGAEVSSGVYFARLLAGGQPAVAKFVFMR